MSKRVSHSLLDPYVAPPIKRLYGRLSIPRWYPPEGIILIGHLSAIAGAIGFAYSTSAWWGGLLVAAGVFGNHFADCIDGTHARATSQCRNGGELLDHFTDPLSFSYWLIGWGVSIGRLDLAIAAVVILYATAVLTNIKAKMLGEFALASFGPTEFKTLLVLYGVAMTLIVAAGGGPPVTAGDTWLAGAVAYWSFVTILIIGVVQLVVNLILAVRDVNRHGQPADTTEWEVSRTTPEVAAVAQGTSADSIGRHGDHTEGTRSFQTDE